MRLEGHAPLKMGNKIIWLRLVIELLTKIASKIQDKNDQDKPSIVIYIYIYIYIYILG